MQQREMEAEDGAFLAAVLRGARREHAADLADQRALHPQRTRLVEKRAHLAGHVAVARRRAENDRVVIRQVFTCHDRRRLVKLGAAFLQYILGTRLRYALAVDRGLGLSLPFGNGLPLFFYLSI